MFNYSFISLFNHSFTCLLLLVHFLTFAFIKHWYFFPVYFQVIPQAKYIMFDFFSFTLNLSKTDFCFTKIFKIQKAQYNLYYTLQILEDLIVWLIVSKIKKKNIIVLRNGKSWYGAFQKFCFFPPINLGDLKSERPS